LTAVANAIDAWCSHVSVRDDNGQAFVLAIGLNPLRSLEVRATASGFEVEWWNGIDESEEYIGTELFATKDALIPRVEHWLMVDSGG